MRSLPPPPPEPVAWTSLSSGSESGFGYQAPDHPRPSPPSVVSSLSPPPCVHDWRHTGVRWWIDASDPPVSWVRYVDQFYCRRCLEVEGRPIDYRHRLNDLSAKAGTFAADSELGARLRDAALVRVSAAAAAPEPAAPAAAGTPADRAD